MTKVHDFKLSPFYKPFFASETENFFDRLNMLMQSGVTIDSALDAIEKESPDFIVKKCISFLKSQIENGAGISKAVENSRLFSSYVVSILKAGESSGRLVEYLELLALQEAKNRVFKSRISSALMYPAIVFFVALTVAIGVSWFILPRLAGVFLSMNTKLPKITEMVMRFGEFLRVHGAVAVPLFLLAVFAIVVILFFVPKTKYAGQVLMFLTPGVGTLIMQSEVARFSYLFGTLLNSGVPIGSALISISEVTPFFYYKRLYLHLARQINQGQTFEQAFKTHPFNTKLFPVSVQQVFYSAEKSGRLADSLVKISQKYEEKSSNTSKNLGVLIEPVFLVIVWAFVMFIALAVILPIYNLIGGINDRPDERVMYVENGQAAVVENSEVIESTNSLEQIVVLENPKLEILQTPQGYLNVRQSPSTTASIVSRVDSGTQHEFIDEQNNWFLIILNNETNGWVFGEYVKQL